MDAHSTGSVYPLARRGTLVLPRRFRRGRGPQPPAAAGRPVRGRTGNPRGLLLPGTSLRDWKGSRVLPYDVLLHPADLPQTFTWRNKGGGYSTERRCLGQPAGRPRRAAGPAAGRYRAGTPRSRAPDRPFCDTRRGEDPRTPPHLRASPPGRSVRPGQAGPGAASSPAGGPGQPLPGPEDAAERGALGRAATRKHRLRKRGRHRRRGRAHARGGGPAAGPAPSVGAGLAARCPGTRLARERARKERPVPGWLRHGRRRRCLGRGVGPALRAGCCGASGAFLRFTVKGVQLAAGLSGNLQAGCGGVGVPKEENCGSSSVQLWLSSQIKKRDASLVEIMPLSFPNSLAFSCLKPSMGLVFLLWF